MIIIKYKYIIWDWNGTLYDDINQCFDTINQLLTERNLPPLKNLDEYRNVFCFPIRTYYDRLKFDFTNETFEELAHKYIDIYREKAKKASLFKQTEETLQKLKDAGLKQFIISASESNILEQQVSSYGIRNYFSELVGLDNHFAESKISLAEKWIDEKNLNKNEILFIGDTVHDNEVASFNGCDCLLIANGHQTKNTLYEVNQNIVDDISKVYDFIIKS